MSSGLDKAIKDFVQVIQEAGNKGTSPLDTQAEVRRVEGDIAWVHIPGGVDETPVKLTIAAKAGDVVQVCVVGGRAWLTGNATNPPTDDTTAKRAINLGKQANDAAIRATKDAMVAHEAAESASADAKTAKEVAESVEGIAEQARTDAGIAKSAAEAIQGLAVEANNNANQAKESAQAATESATTAGRAAAIAQAAAEAAQGDIDEQKNWFWHDSLGAHILGAESGYRTDIASDGMNITAIGSEKTIAHLGADNIVLGSLYEAIRNVITNTRLAFQTDSGDIAYFGLNEDNIWQMYIATTYVGDMIRFGDYAWIKRENGNMTIKWLGGVE